MNQSEGTFYLIFQSILKSDAGVYRCEITGTVGHIINVHISGELDFFSIFILNQKPQFTLHGS